MAPRERRIVFKASETSGSIVDPADDRWRGLAFPCAGSVVFAHDLVLCRRVLAHRLSDRLRLSALSKTPLSPSFARKSLPAGLMPQTSAMDCCVRSFRSFARQTCNNMSPRGLVRAISPRSALLAPLGQADQGVTRRPDSLSGLFVRRNVLSLDAITVEGCAHKQD